MNTWDDIFGHNKTSGICYNLAVNSYIKMRQVEYML